jgi:hypothetical protein
VKKIIFGTLLIAAVSFIVTGATKVPPGMLQPPKQNSLVGCFSTTSLPNCGYIILDSPYTTTVDSNGITHLTLQSAAPLLRERELNFHPSIATGTFTITDGTYDPQSLIVYFNGQKMEIPVDASVNGTTVTFNTYVPNIPDTVTLRYRY